MTVAASATRAGTAGQLSAVLIYQGAEKLAGYVVLAILARHLEVSSLGELFFAATLCMFAGLATELGTNVHLVRRVAPQPERAAEHLAQVISLRLPLFALVLAALNGIGRLAAPELAPTLLLTSVYTMLQELSWCFAACLVGLRRVVERVAVGLVGPLLLVLLVPAVLRAGGGLHAVLAGYVAAHAVGLAIAFAVVRRRAGPLPLAWRPAEAAEVLRASLPLFALGLLGLAHFKADSLLLGLLRSYEAVAEYEIPYKVFEVSRMLIRPFSIVFFPVLAGLAARGGWDEFASSGRRLLGGVGALGLVAAGAVFVVAEPLLALLFGPGYAASAPVLRVLFLSAPALFVVHLGSFVAAALHRERTLATATALCLLANAGLNLVAIPRWGALGAAWITFATESGLALWTLVLVFAAVRARRTEAA